MIVNAVNTLTLSLGLLAGTEYLDGDVLTVKIPGTNIEFSGIGTDT
jgi:hypothetical protein